MLNLSRSRRPSGDAGLTLMELVVAMSLTVIVGVMAVTFFVRSGIASRQATDQALDASTARIVLDSWTTLLRLADSPTVPGSSNGRIESLSADDIVFNANIGNRSGDAPRSATTKIHLMLAHNSGGATPCGNDGTGDASSLNCLIEVRTLGGASQTRVLLKRVIADPLFTAQPADYSSPAAITTVTVAFTVQGPPTDPGTQSYASTVAITGRTG